MLTHDKSQKLQPTHYQSRFTDLLEDTSSQIRIHQPQSPQLSKLASKSHRPGGRSSGLQEHALLLAYAELDCRAQVVLKLSLNEI